MTPLKPLKVQSKLLTLEAYVSSNKVVHSVDQLDHKKENQIMRG